jgi:lysozyme
LHGILIVETLIQRIQRHEGFVQFPKVDVPPHFVVGYGHDISKDEVPFWVDGITQDQAMTLLLKDIAIAQKQLSSHFPLPVDLSQLRRDVLTEMVFQLGISRVMGFKNMIAALLDEDYNRASHEMLWNDAAETIPTAWHEETPSRCEELAGLMKNESGNT